MLDLRLDFTRCLYVYKICMFTKYANRSNNWILFNKQKSFGILCGNIETKQACS